MPFLLTSDFRKTELIARFRAKTEGVKRSSTPVLAHGAAGFVRRKMFCEAQCGKKWSAVAFSLLRFALRGGPSERLFAAFWPVQHSDSMHLAFREGVSGCRAFPSSAFRPPCARRAACGEGFQAAAFFPLFLTLCQKAAVRGSFICIPLRGGRRMAEFFGGGNVILSFCYCAVGKSLLPGCTLSCSSLSNEL